MRNCLVIGFAVFHSAFAVAGGSCVSASETRASVYVVSGVLKKLAAPDAQPQPQLDLVAEIKLVHAVIPAATEGEAVVVFYRTSMAQYPGYKMESVLASLESVLACAAPGKYLTL